MSELIPIRTFNWLNAECSNPPDSIFLWPDQSYSSIISNATETEGPLEVCGWYSTDTVPPLAYENCCRSSLDTSLSGGYSSWGISFDTSRHPKSAYGSIYCTIKPLDGAVEYSAAQILANGACIDQFRCFGENSSLSIFEEPGCIGELVNYPLFSTATVFSLPEALNGSFNGYLQNIDKEAVIVYHWTTFYPYYLTAPDYTRFVDTFGTCCLVLATVLSSFSAMW